MPFLRIGRAVTTLEPFRANGVPMASDSLDDLKRRACAAVDALSATLLGVSHAIHANPELSFEEFAACELLVSTLRKEGLDAEPGAFGLETAFVSDFGGRGDACVALVAEYDALPEIGHACGHNLIATASLGAGLALRTLGDRLPGRIRLLGTPAEERGGGKELMARQGAFEGVDAAMMIHPAGFNLIDMPSIAVGEVEVVYRGEAAHASAMPERGRNALDGLVLAYQAIAALRQHIRPTERVHGIITNGGQAPNIVPERAAGRFYVRARNERELEPLKERVIGCFQAGATATGTEVELRWSPVDYLAIRFNEPLAAAFQANAERLGRAFVPLAAVSSRFAGSTDMGNVSHRVPSIHPMLAAAPPHCTIHNAEFALHAGAPIGDAAALDGAKALAMTALDFLSDADLRNRIRNVFEAFRD
jgi:amidohydrolase